MKEKITKLCEFVEKNGRLPKSGVKGEQSLYCLCRYFWNNKYGIAERFPDVASKIKKMRPGACYDILNEKRVKEFWEFVNTHGRLPKQSVKEERNLYDWCGRIRRNNCGLADKFPEVYAKIKELKEKSEG